MSEQLVIYGAGDLAKLMSFYFHHDSAYRIAAFCVDRLPFTDGHFADRPLVAFEDIEHKYPPDEFDMFVAIGYSRMRDRRLMFDRAKQKGFSLANYVSSHALSWPGLAIGENNVLMPSVHVEPFVQIGNNNLFWSDTLVAHGVTVGDHNYFGAKCLLGGNCVIEDGCFLGNGTVLINDIRLRSETQILPGTTVYRTTKPFAKYLGNPARECGSHVDTGIMIRRG